MNTITPGTECPVCGKKHRAGSKPLAVCSAELAERATTKLTQAPEVAPRAMVPSKANATSYSHSMTPTTANGLRLLLPARKSRKGDGESADYTRQTNTRVIERAERDGNKVIKAVEDTISSQSMPWDRKNLKAWMTRPELLTQWDALYVTETDRLARLDDEGFHRIETWLYDHHKTLVTAEDVCFPPRHDGDRYLWVAMKRRARTYWEDVRDKHAQTREDIRANGGAIGRPPFGYRITGETKHKSFVPDPVTGPLAREAFQRIADGRTAVSVAIWLTEATGKLWRVKRVTDMLKRRTYLGERDGHHFEPLVSQALWDAANAAQESRSFQHTNKGGRRTVHAFSGVIYCLCGHVMHRHQSNRGKERYLCSKGRSGNVTQTKCSYPSVLFADANAAIDALMRADGSWPWVTSTTGGDSARQAGLAAIKTDMAKAVANGDMGALSLLSARFTQLDNMPAEPIITKTIRQLDKSVGGIWANSTLADQRAMLADRIITVTLKPDGSIQALDETDAYMYPEESEAA